MLIVLKVFICLLTELILQGCHKVKKVRKIKKMIKVRKSQKNGVKKIRKSQKIKKKHFLMSNFFCLNLQTYFFFKAYKW